MNRLNEIKRTFANAFTFSLGRLRKKGFCGGFTFVEISIALVILGTLAAIGIPAYAIYIERAKVFQAIAEIHELDEAITVEFGFTAVLPADLTGLAVTIAQDPWGNPYEYTNHALTPPGQWRKDQMNNPVNSDYDLYSKGKDGNSLFAFTAPVSFDDVVRANDGRFVGLAIDY